MTKLDWLPEVRDKIESFLLLEENWDSCGARTISKESVLATINWLTSPPQCDVRLTRPFACPTVNGGVSLEWWDRDQDDAHFEITFEKGGVEVYAAKGEEEWESVLGQPASVQALTVLFSHFIER